jgi:hypothetical protein
MGYEDVGCMWVVPSNGMGMSLCFRAVRAGWVDCGGLSFIIDGRVQWVGLKECQGTGLRIILPPLSEDHLSIPELAWLIDRCGVAD